MYKFILLDADDTLYDFGKSEYQSLKATLEHLGLPCSDTIISTYSAINLNLWKLYEKNLIEKETIKTQRFAELFEHLGVHADAYTASEVYRGHLETKSLLLPYAEEVCEELAKHFVLAILTNGVATTQRNRFKLSAIKQHITHLVISEELGTAKPNKAFFDAALDIIGCAPGDALMVGDSLSSDIQGAINAGIDCCWFNPKRLPHEGYDIDYEISDLRELPGLLLKNA